MENSDIDWVKFRYKTYPNTLICLRCEGEFEMPMNAVKIEKYLGILKTFMDIHKKCKQLKH